MQCNSMQCKLPVRDGGKWPYFDWIRRRRAEAGDSPPAPAPRKYKCVLGRPGTGGECKESDKGYKSLIECENACTSLALVMPWVSRPISAVMIRNADDYNYRYAKDVLKKLEANPTWDTALTLPDNVWKNVNFRKAAFRILPRPFSAIPDKVSNNQSIMIAAGIENEYASQSLKQNRAFILEAVQRAGTALKYAAEELKSDPAFVFEAVKLNGRALRDASKDFQNYRDIVLAAVKQNGVALEYASKELQNDPDIVMAAVRQEGWGLMYASKELQNDHDIVMTAVTHRGTALGAASERLQNDHDIVMAAVRHNGNSLVYASETLRNDREIVMEAVKQNGSAIYYASKELQNDAKIREVAYQ